MNRQSRITRVMPCLAAALALATGLAVAQAPALKNDPFARPLLSSHGAPAPGNVPSAARVADAPVMSWNPELTAILSAGKDSMVKVGGVMVRVGEVIDGHRLVAVRESEAVFIAVQDRKRVVLSLSGREGQGK
ncbi:MAG: hypothetical protein A3I02_12230 [Betaproteobacteria bacterium RIFCSPLOWO2_02_FULL_67_26]|nr:MAG: hypothetical protein A3I02_12230 [Betaproteobacteria bacterium RIFCSPLOWO2_02_FULL_67_26]